MSACCHACAGRRPPLVCGAGHCSRLCGLRAEEGEGGAGAISRHCPRLGPCPGKGAEPAPHDESAVLRRRRRLVKPSSSSPCSREWAEPAACDAPSGPGLRGAGRRAPRRAGSARGQSIGGPSLAAGRLDSLQGGGTVVCEGRRATGRGQPGPQPPALGITSNILALSSQRPSGPAGGASDGYGLGRGAAGPGCRCTTTVAGALRVVV